MKTFLKKITPSIGIIIGLVCLLLAIILDNYFKGNFISSILQTLATTFIIASTIGYSIDISMKESLVNLFQSNISICASSNKIGLCKVLHESEYNYKNLLLESKELTMVLSNGKRWISNNFVFLEERFKDEKKDTKFIFLKPDSDAVRLVAQKTKKDGQSVEDKIKNINEKIKDSIRELNQIKNKGNLKIYYSKLNNTQRIFLTESQVVVVLYRNSIGIKNSKVPLLIYNRNDYSSENEYEYIKKDVESILKIAQEVN